MTISTTNEDAPNSPEASQVNSFSDSLLAPNYIMSTSHCSIKYRDYSKISFY